MIIATATTVIIVLIVVAIIAVFWLMGMYNGLVKMRNRYKNAFAQIDVQLSVDTTSFRI